MAIFLALFMGSIQLLLGLFRMGFLVNFLSKPVISGFTSAAAVIIGLSQLKHLLGVSIERSSKIQTLLVHTFKAIESLHFLTVLIGIVTIMVLVLIKRINKKIPAALVVVVLGIISAYLLKLNAQGVKIIEAVPMGLPSFRIPKIDFFRVTELIPIALTLSLISFMEAISIAKAVEENHSDYEVDPNQELVALGSANIMGSFFQSYPTTGGFSRTAINNQAGAKTGVASIVSALIVGLTLLFLTPLFYYLPNSVLAAIIMVAVFSLVDIKYPVQLFKNRKSEFLLLIATFVITLTIGIKEGILLGILISLLFLVYRTSLPHIAILGKIKGTHYFKNIDRFSSQTSIDKEVLLIRFDAQLFFGNKDYFKKELQKNIEAKGVFLNTLILDASSINYIDSSAAYMLKQLINELNTKQIDFFVAGAIGPIRDILFQSGLTDLITTQHLFVTTSEAYEYFQKRQHKTSIQKQIIAQQNVD